MKWMGRLAHMGKRRCVYRILMGKPEGRSPLVRHRRRWEDNIKVYLKYAGWEDMHWIYLTEDRDSGRHFWVW